MTIFFQCADCHRKLKASDDARGRRVRCHRCGSVQRVPEHSTRRPSSQRPRHGGLAEAGATAEEPVRFAPPTLGTGEEVDMTPMIDVVFQLLIFFMITAAFSLQKAIELPPPEVSDAAAANPTLEQLEEDSDFVIVRVDGDNTIWVNDAQAPSRHDLLVKLREARRGLPGAAGRPPRKLLVLASGAAEHEYVVRALDAGTEAGMEEVRLATSEDEYW